MAARLEQAPPPFEARRKGGSHLRVTAHRFHTHRLIARLPPSFPADVFVHQGGHSMTLSVRHLSPIISLIAGILILIMPRLLNYIVAIYLIIIGIIGLGIIK